LLRCHAKKITLFSPRTPETQAQDEQNQQQTPVSGSALAYGEGSAFSVAHVASMTARLRIPAPRS
jgi:hypothetical protein